MPSFRVIDTETGQEMGTFTTATPEAALDACAQAAGFMDHAHVIHEGEGGGLIAVPALATPPNA